MWTHMTTQQEIDAFMLMFGGFHDSCLKELCLSTGYSVAEDLSMTCPSHLDTSVRILFQRQYRAPAAVELCFDKVLAVHILPHAEGQDAIISDATFLLVEGTIYWVDRPGWAPKHPDRAGPCSWISAKKVAWRDASRWLGPAMRYGPR